MFSLVVVWVGCDLIFHFQVAGRYLDLLLTFLVGGLSLTAVGVLMASRGVSEEFTSGVLNFITWPMMFSLGGLVLTGRGAGMDPYRRPGVPPDPPDRRRSSHHAGRGRASRCGA
jgi:hypothetical protein